MCTKYNNIWRIVVEMPAVCAASIGKKIPVFTQGPWELRYHRCLDNFNCYD